MNEAKDGLRSTAAADPPKLVARLSAAAAVAGGALFLLAGCITRPQQPSRVETMRDLALLSSLGDETGVKVISVDSIPLAKGGPVSRHPSDAPAGMNSSLGIWLSPGFHLIQVQYVRNIEGGISFTKGEVPLVASAGRTYIAHAAVASDFGQVSFTLIDHGASFPIGCLPWSISMAKPPDARGKRAGFTREDILACRKRTPP